MNKCLEFRVHEIESQCILKTKHFNLDLIDAKFLNVPTPKLEMLLDRYSFKSCSKQLITQWREMFKPSYIIKPDLINTNFVLYVIPEDKQNGKCKMLYRHSEYLIEAKKDYSRLLYL